MSFIKNAKRYRLNNQEHLKAYDEEFMRQIIQDMSINEASPKAKRRVLSHRVKKVSKMKLSADEIQERLQNYIKNCYSLKKKEENKKITTVKPIKIKPKIRSISLKKKRRKRPKSVKFLKSPKQTRAKSEQRRNCKDEFTFRKKQLDKSSILHIFQLCNTKKGFLWNLFCRKLRQYDSNPLHAVDMFKIKYQQKQWLKIKLEEEANPYSLYGEQKSAHCKEGMSKIAILKKREYDIQRRNAKKGLLLKQVKLFKACENDQMHLALHSGFAFYENDTNIYNKEKKTVLYYTCKNKNLEFTQFLIQHGAEIHRICDKVTGNYPIHLAFETDNINDIFLLMYLIRIGADLNVLNKKLQTPLAFASNQLLGQLGLKNGIMTRQNINLDDYKQDIQSGKIFDNNKLFSNIRPQDECYIPSLDKQPIDFINKAMVDNPFMKRNPFIQYKKLHCKFIKSFNKTKLMMDQKEEFKSINLPENVGEKKDRKFKRIKLSELEMKYKLKGIMEKKAKKIEKLRKQYKF